MIRRILFALAFAMLAISAMAQDFLKPEQRTSSHPGVSKADILERMAFDDRILQHALQTPYVDPSWKVYDFTNQIPASDIEMIRSRCLDFVDENDCDIAVVFIDQPTWDDKRNEDFNMDFYDYNDFGVGAGHDGVCLVINLPTHRFAIFDTGNPCDRGLAANNLYRLEEAMKPYFRNNSFGQGVVAFVDKYESCLNAGNLKPDGYPFCLAPRTEQNLQLYYRNLVDSANAYPSFKKTVLATPHVDPDWHYYDFTGKTTEAELKVAREACDRFINKNSIEFFIVLVDMYDWNANQLADYVYNIALCNKFASSDGYKKGIYFGYNVSTLDLAVRSIGDADRYVTENWDNIRKVIDSKNYTEMMPSFLSMMESFITGVPMVPEGKSLSDRVAEFPGGKQHFWDISACMSDDQASDISQYCQQMVGSNGRNINVVSVFAPSFNDRDLKSLASQMMEKCSGDNVTMLAINQYDRNFVVVNDDEGRTLDEPTMHEISKRLSGVYEQQYLSSYDIKAFLHDYYYLSATPAERMSLFFDSEYEGVAEVSCVAIPLGILISLILVSVLKNRKFSVKGNTIGARHYLVKNSYKVHRKNIIKGSTSVTRVYVPPSSSSSSGSRGGYRSGSSGTRHSGGSGGW